jgi:hypothetical protein
MNRSTNHLRATLVATILLAAIPASRASADTLTLMWDFNLEPDVTGYQVYVGSQPGTYTQIVDVGNTNTFVMNNFL